MSTSQFCNLSHFNRIVVSDSFRLHWLQHTRPPYPSSTPGACSHSYPSSRWCHLTISSSVAPSPPAFNLSKHQGLFHWVSSSHQVAKYWSFTFSISLSNAYSALISFRIDWFDLLAVQGILKSLLQHHSSKASILWHSAVFMVQLSHPYMTTVETIDLTRWTFASKVMLLLFNRLSRFVIVFHPRSKCLLTMAAVTICSDFGAPKNSLSLFPLFPCLFARKWWDKMPWSEFFKC